MDTTEPHAHERDEYRMSPEPIGPTHFIWVPVGVRLTDAQLRELCGDEQVRILRARAEEEDE